MSVIYLITYISLGATVNLCSGAAIYRQGPGMSLWPRNPAAVMVDGAYNTPLVRVGFVRDGAYSLSEYRILKEAMTQISIQTKNCIKFQLYNPLDTTVPSHPIHFRQNFSSPNRTAAVCETHNGYYAALGSVRGQSMILFGQTNAKPGGCLSDERDAMRYLVNLLGVGNEYLRADRSSALAMEPNYRGLVADSLKTADLLEINVNDPLEILTPEFDIESITMISGSRYAQTPQSPLFRITTGKRVPTDAKLSRLDCETLNYLYECDIGCDEEAPPSGGFSPPKLATNLNCWPKEESGQSISDIEFMEKLGILGLVRPNVTGLGGMNFEIDSLSSRSGADSVAVNRDKRPTFQTREAELSLKTKISKSLSTSIFLVGKNYDGNSTEGRVYIEVNCYPQFKAFGKEVNCQLDEQPGTQTETCTATEPDAITAQCVSKKIPASYSFGPVEAIDPDGGMTEFLSVSSDRPGDESGWGMRDSGIVFRLGDLIVPGPFNFTFVYFDAQIAAVKNLRLTVTIVCQ